MNPLSHDARRGKAAILGEGAGKEGQPRKLPKEIRRGGFRYRQIWRKDDVAIYEQSWSDGVEGSECFEVIRIRVCVARQIGGRRLEAGERYPGSEDWGTYGWTYTDRDQAFRKARSLLVVSVRGCVAHEQNGAQKDDGGAEELGPDVGAGGH
jgi:hypothetical protein